MWQQGWNWKKQLKRRGSENIPAFPSIIFSCEWARWLPLRLTKLRGWSMSCLPGGKGDPGKWLDTVPLLCYCTYPEGGASFAAAQAQVQTPLLATARKGELTSEKAAAVHLISCGVVTRCVGFQLYWGSVFLSSLKLGSIAGSSVLGHHLGCEWKVNPVSRPQAHTHLWPSRWQSSNKLCPIFRFGEK